MTRADDVKSFIVFRELAEERIAQEVGRAVADLFDCAVGNCDAATVLMPGEILPLADGDRPELKVTVRVIVERAVPDPEKQL